MDRVNFKAEISGSFDDVIERVTSELKKEGFGVLTRIDLHSKLKEKIGKDIAPVVILGACNPQLAYEAFERNTDVASLLPCNAVVREIKSGRCSVEFAKPTAMMGVVGDDKLVELAQDADRKLERCLAQLSARRAA